MRTLGMASQTGTGAFAGALTPLVASGTMNWVRALSSAVRAFGLHPKGRPFKSDSAHHFDAIPFSGDVVQLVRTLPFCCTLSGALLCFLRETEAQNLHDLGPPDFESSAAACSATPAWNLRCQPEAKSGSPVQNPWPGYADCLPEIAVYP